MEKEEIIGGMRVVTGGTASFGYRAVLRFGPLLSLHCVRMTGPAHITCVCAEKALLGGCVRIMAVQAPLTIQEGGVNPVFTQDIIHHLCMASPAQINPHLLDFEGAGSSRRLMALVAHPVGNWLVDIIIDYSRVVGSVGIMTGGTPCLCHGIIHVFQLKAWFVCFMAAEAEGRHRILQVVVGME